MNDLLDIYESAKEAGIKASALWLLTQLPNEQRALQFLEEVAVSPTTYASTAIRYLLFDMGEPGLSRLRKLYETDAVVDSAAREHLMGLAEHHGWTR